MEPHSENVFRLGFSFLIYEQSAKIRNSLPEFSPILCFSLKSYLPRQTGSNKGIRAFKKCKQNHIQSCPELSKKLHKEFRLFVNFLEKNRNEKAQLCATKEWAHMYPSTHPRLLVNNEIMSSVWCCAQIPSRRLHC